MNGVVASELAIRDRKQPPDRRIARIAERQHGVVAHRQLIALGLRRSGIQRRVDDGRLHQIYLGVYAVGHRLLSGRGRWMSGVLAFGPTALLSHRSAAELWGIRPASTSRIHVTAPGRTRHRSQGIVLHLPRHLRQEDRLAREGIPVTSVARTLVDLAGVVPAQELRRAVEDAERLELFDLRSIEPLLSTGRRGVRDLRAVIRESAGPPPITRSELERLFLDACRQAGLPLPQTNVLIVGFEVDAAWPDRRLVVELDSHAFHRNREMFERDRQRDAVLQVAGYRVLRVTHRRLNSEPARVLKQVQSLLSRSPERRGGAPVADARALRGDPAG